MVMAGQAGIESRRDADMRYYLVYIRVVAIAMAALLSAHALVALTVSAAFASESHAEERKSGCDECAAWRTHERALCSGKYLILFFWYASMAVAFVVVIVMDITTGFSQNFVKSFIDWFKDSDAGLKKFFRKLGC